MAGEECAKAKLLRRDVAPNGAQDGSSEALAKEDFKGTAGMPAGLHFLPELHIKSGAT